MYKTVVIEYSPKADNMAEKIEEKANEMLQNGYVLIDTVKQRDNDIDGYVESIGFVLGC